MQFKEVIAQKDIKQQLIASVKSNKVSQAMLFLGNEGTGKLSTALALAQYLNCQNPSETDSCNECASCTKAKKLMHPDIFYTYPTIGAKSLAQESIAKWREMLKETAYINYNDWIAFLDSENKQGNITAEECNQIIRQHGLRHFEGKYKVQIIWGAEFLKKEGNRLLKLIEEPPANTVFLLIAQNQEDILPTILSRTQLIKFSAISLDDIRNNLQEIYHLSEVEAHKIAQIADGSWIDAVNLIGKTDSDYFQYFRQWMLYIIQLKARPNLEFAEGLINWCDEMGSTGRQNQKAFLKYALFFIREGFAAQNNVFSKLNNDEQDTALKMINTFSWQKMISISQIINNLHYEIVRNANAKIAFYSTSMKIKALLNKA